MDLVYSSIIAGIAIIVSAIICTKSVKNQSRIIEGIKYILINLCLKYVADLAACFYLLNKYNWRKFI